MQFSNVSFWLAIQANKPQNQVSVLSEYLTSTTKDYKALKIYSIFSCRCRHFSLLPPTLCCSLGIGGVIISYFRYLLDSDRSIKKFFWEFLEILRKNGRKRKFLLKRLLRNEFHILHISCTPYEYEIRCETSRQTLWKNRRIRKGNKYKHKCLKIRTMIILSRELHLILIFNLRFFQKGEKVFGWTYLDTYASTNGINLCCLLPALYFHKQTGLIRKVIIPWDHMFT